MVCWYTPYLQVSVLQTSLLGLKINFFSTMYFPEEQIDILERIVYINTMLSMVTVFIKFASNILSSTSSSSSHGTTNENIVTFTMLPLTFFLSTTIFSLCLKHMINQINRHTLRLGMLLCVVGSVFGYFFFMISLYHHWFIRVALNLDATVPTVPIFLLFTIGLVIHVSINCYVIIMKT